MAGYYHRPQAKMFGDGLNNQWIGALERGEAGKVTVSRPELKHALLQADGCDSRVVNQRTSHVCS